VRLSADVAEKCRHASMVKNGNISFDIARQFGIKFQFFQNANFAIFGLGYYV
jgi:hypothetical protein